jgi:hypothetical protein
MSLGDESGLGPDPATYAPLGQPGAIPPNEELVPENTLEDDPLGDHELDDDRAITGENGDA